VGILNPPNLGAFDQFPKSADYDHLPEINSHHLLVAAAFNKLSA